MHKVILTPTAFILILFVSSCVRARTAEPVGTPQPLTTADLDGKWKVEGLFQGGQGGYRLLEFKRIKD